MCEQWHKESRTVSKENIWNVYCLDKGATIDFCFSTGIINGGKTASRFTYICGGEPTEHTYSKWDIANIALYLALEVTQTSNSYLEPFSGCFLKFYYSSFEKGQSWTLNQNIYKCKMRIRCIFFLQEILNFGWFSQKSWQFMIFMFYINKHI